MSYPCSYLTADAILIVADQVLLVQRKNEPFKGKWAFPGGFIDENEGVLDGAKRELQEETGIENVSLSQFGAYADPGRDPRGRTVSIVFWSFLTEKPEAKASDDAANCEWFLLNQLPQMAFDHELILSDVRRRIQEK
jgi:8-oxo-dGTP diphosphatase